MGYAHSVTQEAVSLTGMRARAVNSRRSLLVQAVRSGLPDSIVAVYLSSSLCSRKLSDSFIWDLTGIYEQNK